MSRLIRSIGDFDAATTDALLDRASEFAAGAAPPGLDRAPVLGLVFLEASLRTRVGFEVAAARLGWRSVEVRAARSGLTSMSESWTDTLRTVSGMVDAIVARPGFELDSSAVARWSRCPVLSGGDVGADAEHPSQALIDRFAIDRLAGPVRDCRVAMVGDLRMRAARSLLRLLAMSPPRRLLVVTDPSLAEPAGLPPALAPIIEQRALPDVDDVDVLWVGGIPHGAANEHLRTRLRVDAGVLARLPAASIVLSPMPLLDELGDDARSDPRVRMHDQSDLGVFVRMAILETLAPSP